MARRLLLDRVMVLHRRALLLATIFAILLTGGGAWASTNTGACPFDPFAGTPFSPFFFDLNQVFSAGAKTPQSVAKAAKEAKEAKKAKRRAIRQPRFVDRDDHRCRLAPDRRLLRKYHRRAHLSPTEFIYLIAPFAQRAEEETGVPASVTIAQAIQETGFGASAHGAGNNLFGIKGRGSAGSLWLYTQEYYGGRYVTIRARFAAYRSLQDAIMAHARFVRTGYFRNTRRDFDRPMSFVSQVARDGYATDPNYAGELDGLIRSYRLERFDDTRICPK